MEVTGGQKGLNLPGGKQDFKRGQCQKGILAVSLSSKQYIQTL